MTKSEALPDLFARALELEEGDRRALLVELADREPRLAAELARLLKSAGHGDSPLDLSPWRDLAESAAEESALPQRIGPYRILGELGRGGMGRVFLAEEATEDFRRTVALKVIDRPTLDDDAVRRFRDEVRILSRLEHPGIARFLGGGRSPEGIWFLAVEFVDGVDLIRWARQQALSIPARVELFLTVLDPVRFAHAQGVVHRDLKPDHLLIDRDGRPRLLDFGISKLIDPETQQSLAATRTESRALTPAYASPEQFRGEPVTPASDVYALGAVLYELLAGRRPFAEVGGSRSALEHAVLDLDPAPPSTAPRMGPSEDLVTPRTGPRRKRRSEVGRDLDAICLKALRKSPIERYADAGELAADLRRHLVGQPVEARLGGRRYRMARFARRHRGRFGLASAILVAVAATLFAIGSHRRAERAESVSPAPRAFPFSDAADQSIEELRDRFANAPESVETGAALALALSKRGRGSEARLILARLRQIPDPENQALIDYVDADISMDLDEPQRALVYFTRAHDRSLAEGRGELVAQVRASRGRLLSILGRRDEARQEMELALGDFEEAGDSASASRVLNDLAIEHLQRGDFDEGAALLERAAAEARTAGNVPSTMLHNLARLSTLRGRPDLAEARLREVLVQERAAGNRRAEGNSLYVLASALHDQGRREEAESAIRESVALLREVSDQAGLRSSLETQALMDLESARIGRAEAIAEEIENAADAAGGYAALAVAWSLKGRVAGARGDLETMRRAFAEARQLQVENGDLDSAADSDAAQAEIEFRSGNLQEAGRLADQALARLSDGAAGGAPLVTAAAIRVRVDAGEGRLEAARVRLARLPDPLASPSLGQRLHLLPARAGLAAAEGRLDLARGDLNTAIELAGAAERSLAEVHLRFDLAALERAAGDLARAAQLAGPLALEAKHLGLMGLAERSRKLVR